MRWPAPDELRVRRLGEPRFASPLSGPEHFVDDSDRVLLCSSESELASFVERDEPPPSFEPAGPRAELYFEPPSTTCALVTCGGLCPGLHDVVRAIVFALHHGYRVGRVLGFRFGFQGLTREPHRPPIELDPGLVEHLHHYGGSLLGTSRGPQPVPEMVDVLADRGVDTLFAIGGDGTMRGAAALVSEIEARGLDIAVVGVPKTIDNDLPWVERSFGFATAVEEARAALTGAYAEARSVWNGVGLVKLMGRHAGFIAAHATLASGQANFCLVPEVPFRLDGESGLMAQLVARLEERRHALVVVAEGAGQDLLPPLPEEERRDASGNVRLADIGAHLRRQIEEHCEAQGIDIELKYIDPSYLIRSRPANTFDAGFAQILGQHAVHAAMAGRTELMIGLWNERFTHVPLALATSGRDRLDPKGEVWQRVLATTRQPRLE